MDQKLPKSSLKKASLLITLGLLLSFLSCKNDSEPEVLEVPKAGSVMLVDIANSGSVADFRVSFNIAVDESNIQEYRVYIVKLNARSGFDLASAIALDDSKYFTVPVTGENGKLNIPSGQQDIDGNTIEIETDYVVFVLSQPKVPETYAQALSSASNPSKLKDEPVVLTLVENLSSATGGVAVDHQGNIYVADIGPVPNRGGSTVFKITPSGGVSVFASGNQLINPSGNTFDAEGNLYQSNLSGRNILKINPDGTISVYADQMISSPVGLIMDQDKNLFVANCGSNSIALVKPDGTTSILATSNLFRCPNGIALDPEGNLYVTNFEGGAVLKVTPDGNVSTFTNLPGGNNGHITYHNGFFYAISRGGNRIYTLDLNGNLTSFAGTGIPATLDGSVSEAAFTLPNDLAISPDGKTLYFNHSINTNGINNAPSVIRKIILD
ncbi:MAG: hypothetical protein HEP71_19925 [Roseivirga sp.]|nr:hypothetical protein [Roseivirga sp.]